MKEATRWFMANTLKLNEDKTFNMFFTLLQMNGTEINKIQKFLDLRLDAKLTWKSHIDYIVNKLSCVLFMFRTLVNEVSTDVLLTVYNAHFVSILDYGMECCCVKMSTLY